MLMSLASAGAFPRPLCQGCMLAALLTWLPGVNWEINQPKGMPDTPAHPGLP